MKKSCLVSNLGGAKDVEICTKRNCKTGKTN